MGSVIVTWSGGCADAARRDTLSARIIAMGDQSHGYFSEPPPHMQWRGEAYLGRIVVDRGVFTPNADLAALPTAYEAPPRGPISLGNPLTPEPKAVRDDLLVVEEAVLEGAAFRLYDGRGLYADDVVSFVFARFPGHPELGHRLVEVTDGEGCRAINNAAVADADLYLGRPDIHLRYYCEEWMDWLLAAVKTFHVPDLAYWRYEEQPGFDKITAEIAQLDPATAEATVFAYLADRLEQEVEANRETAAQASAFWSAMRKAADDG